MVRVFAILGFLFLSALGCNKGTAIPRANESNLTPETEQKIRDLIEQLASKNSSPTGEGPFGLDYPDDWSEEHQQVVYGARKQLSDFGKPAFPILLESFDDDRYSLSGSAAVYYNLSVGVVCAGIIESNIHLSGIGYKFRTGADGESHIRPNYFRANYGGDPKQGWRSNLKKSVKQWWASNRNKSLKQMRIDVLKWRIKQEDKIGFPDDESRKKFRGKLTDKLFEIEAGS